MNRVRFLIPLLLAPLAMPGPPLHLKRREVPVDDGQMATTEAPGPRWMAGRSHLILQFRHAPDDALIHELNHRGAFVVGAVPTFGLVLSAPDDFTAGGLPATWSGRLRPDDKISPLLETARGNVFVVAEFFADVDMTEARRLAEAAGFRVRRHPDIAKNHLLLSGEAGRLPALAQWDEVSYLFPASRELVRGSRVSSCAGALTSGGSSTPQFVTASTGWPKNAAGRVVLSYVFGTLTGKVPQDQATAEILRALNQWARYVPVEFVAGTDPNASQTIAIKFASGNHGDGLPFDGPGGILAHTFYPAPPNGEGIAGDMHFDADENWRVGSNTDVYTVALHEAGHALGLAHSDNPADIMYPYYRLGSQLAPDDIAGVQSLYGTLSGAPPAPTLTLTITAPSTGATVPSSIVAVTGTSANASGPERITWQTDHGFSGVAAGTTQWSIAAVPLMEGANTITVTAADSAHQSAQAVMVTRPTTSSSSNTDHTPPGLTIVSPPASTVNTTAGTITVAGTASDNVAVAKVTWQNAQSSGTATGTNNWTAGPIPLLVGSNIITIRAYDVAGNHADRSILVIRR